MVTIQHIWGTLEKLPLWSEPALKIENSEPAYLLLGDTASKTAFRDCMAHHSKKSEELLFPGYQEYRYTKIGYHLAPVRLLDCEKQLFKSK